MKILIATTKAPKPGAFEQLCSDLREFAAFEFDVVIEPGIIYTQGPGCYNLAMELTGPASKCHEVGKMLCMAMMPAKWTETFDKLPSEDTLVL